MLFVTAGLFAMFYFASLYVQDVLGYSPLTAGLAFLPVTAGIVIGAALSQVAIKAMSVRYVPLIGIALASGGLFLLGRIPTHGSYLRDLLPGLLLMSIGIGLEHRVGGRGARLRASEHDATGRRCARARDPFDARHQ
jgi:Na+/melibiose symporter-like transporter